MNTGVKCFTLSLVFVLAFAVLGEPGEEMKMIKMDEAVQDFTLKDAMDKEHSLKALSKDKKATVIMFIATQCPVSNAYNERMVKLYNDYKDKGIQFIGINSNKQESVKEIAKHSKDNGLEFVILKDLQNKIADYFDAKRTPEIYLLDENLVLRYHGAIDNSQDNPDKHYLREVIGYALEGKEIPKDAKETKAFGCTIKRVDKERTPKRTP
jgi:peroxiredoxin